MGRLLAFLAATGPSFHRPHTPGFHTCSVWAGGMSSVSWALPAFLMASLDLPCGTGLQAVHPRQSWHSREITSQCKTWTSGMKGSV